MVETLALYSNHEEMHGQAKMTQSNSDAISYPLFVHAIRENINGLGSYHTARG